MQEQHEGAGKKQDEISTGDARMGSQAGDSARAQHGTASGLFVLTAPAAAHQAHNRASQEGAGAKRHGPA